MEGGSLFNSGFLGNNFQWWIGQIADDSGWRDNILPGKFESKDSIPGWGRRYKVRIMGIHDKEEETIPSDQLPWANVMYPITAGGGQSGASQTPALRQGNFVFGFFLDGQDQQVPVIMGILGNNAQTSLKTSIGNNDSNFAATSGYAEGKTPKTGSAKEKAPDEGLVVTKPKSEEQSKECAAAPEGTQVNSYGLRSDLPLTSQQLADAQSARAEAADQGLSREATEALVQQRVADGIKNRCQQASSTNSPAQPGATKENPDAVHETSAGDVKRQEKYDEKIPLLKPDPDEVVNSALKAVQIEIDNLTKKIDKYLSTFSSYVDAVSSTISDIDTLIHNVACQIAKYLKILFDQMMEYTLKVLNKEMAAAVAGTPSSTRYMLADIKEQTTELILCLYNNLIEGLCSMIEGLLQDTFNIDELEQIAQENADLPEDQRTNPQVPICYAEDLAGQVISSSSTDINDFNQTIFDNINTFLSDIDDQVAGVSDSLADITNQLGSISGDITSALSFTNISLNVFGCQLTPTKSISDYYQLAVGGSGQPDTQLPSAKSVADSSVQPTTAAPAAKVPYAEPSKDQRDVNARGSYDPRYDG